MTLPLREPDPSRANWLAKYIAVQQLYDKKIIKALQDASVDAAKVAAQFEGKDNISSKNYRYQMAVLRKEIHAVLNDLYAGFIPIIKQGHADAAEAAAQATLEHEKAVLKLLFPNPNERKQFEASFKQTARENIRAMINRILEPQWPLSERVWKSKSLAQGTLDRKINSAIARGASAKNLAKIVREDIKQGAPGGTSYCAMRLARTEINNAYHAQSIGQAQDSPWVAEMEWHLSLSHKEQDCLCEYYADEQFFEVGDVPPKPHPQCMCYVTPVSIGYDNFADQLKAGAFDDYFEKTYGMKAA